MSASSRFTVAIHILTLLALRDGKRLTSEYIASSVNTSPVVIRRLLGHLRRAQLVLSKGGPNGGWQLARSPRAITFRDIYRAVEVGGLFPLHSSTPNLKCPVGKNIREALQAHFENAQIALEDDLAKVTVATLLDEVSKD